MKVSYIKYRNDLNSFKIPKLLGMNVLDIDNPEEIDKKLEELKKQNYTSIFVTNEIASFSENIVNKYQNDDKLNIIITPNKRINN